MPGDCQTLLYVSLMMVMIEKKKTKKEFQLHRANLMYVHMSKEFFLTYRFVLVYDNTSGHLSWVEEETPFQTGSILQQYNQ